MSARKKVNGLIWADSFVLPRKRKKLNVDSKQRSSKALSPKRPANGLSEKQLSKDSLWSSCLPTGPPQTRICNKCKIEKSFLEGFHKRPDSAGGRNTICKACRKRPVKYDPKRYRNNILKNRYGITEQQYNEIWELQGKKCAACLAAETKGNGWNLDHDHVTKKVRGILCHHCNMTIGNSKEEERRLRGCIQYLRYHKLSEGSPLLIGMDRFKGVPRGGIGNCK